MVRAPNLVVLLLAAVMPGIAFAGCAEDVEMTRGRLMSLEAEPAAGSPQESWLGEPSSAMDVKKLLDGARDLAREGNEDACDLQHMQAKSVLSGLESKRGAQKAERTRKTEEIRKNLDTKPQDAPAN